MADRLPIWQSAAMAFALYLLASIVLIGHGTYAHFGSTSVGNGPDPALFMWSLEWLPRALIDGLGLLHTDLVFAPEGFNTTLVTSIAAPSLVMAPVTLLAGPLISYNVLSILIPAIDAWAAYLLCRAAGARAWPSLAGGYVFGFSSYVLAQSLGHPNLSLVAMVPLAVWLVLRRLRGEISPVVFVAGLTGTLVFQFFTSTEIFLTMTLAGVVALILAASLFPAQRGELFAASKLILRAYALTALLASPYLIAFLGSDQSFNHIHPTTGLTDPINLVIPTSLSIGGDQFYSLSQRFSGNVFETGSYLGIPMLIVLALYAWRSRRERGATLLLAMFAIALVASLGPHLTVLGASTGLPLPWALPVDIPLTRYILPVRMMMFAWLALAVIVAVWLSSDDRMHLVRWGIVLAGLICLLPNPRALTPEPGRTAVGLWAEPRPLPALFENDDSPLFRGHPNILVLPYNEAGDAEGTYWQANTGMAYAMPGGYVSGTLPDTFTCWPAVELLRRETYPEVSPREFLDFLAAKEVDLVLVLPTTARAAGPMLSGLEEPWRRVGGMIAIPVPKHLRPTEIPSDCSA